MKFLETGDMKCRLTIDKRVYTVEGDAYTVGRQFLNQLANTVHKKFEIELIRPPQFEDLTPEEIERLKDSKYAAFLAVHIGLTSYGRLGIEQEN